MRRFILVFALPMILSAQAFAHALWVQSQRSGGYAVYYGEVDENQGDSLVGWQSQHLEIWNLGGEQAKARLFSTHLDLQTSASEMRLTYRNSPVHGEGADAGRALFFARVAVDGKSTKDTLQLPLDLRLDAQGNATLHQSGKPLANWEYSCRSGTDKAVEAKTDGQGRLTLPAAKGNDIVCATWIEKAESGNWLGKPYQKVWYVTTLTIVNKAGTP